MDRTQSLSLRRMRMVIAAMALIWAGRLAWVQVIARDHYLNPTNIDYSPRTILPAAKGELHDRNGKVLARCVDSASVVANPQLIADPAQVAGRLASIIDEPVDTLIRLLSKRYRRVLLRANVPDDVVATLRGLVDKGIVTLGQATAEPAWTITARPREVKATPEQRQDLAVLLGLPVTELDATLAQPATALRLAELADAATAEQVARMNLDGIKAEKTASAPSRAAYLEPVAAAFELKLADGETVRQPVIRPEVWAALAPLWRGVKAPAADELARRLKVHYVALRRQLPVALGDALRAQIDAEHIPGVRVDREMAREYPQGGLARTMLGKVDREERGTGGLEQALNQRLTGTSGWMEVTVDGRGRPILQERAERHEPVHGRNIELTVDATIQSYAEEAVRNAVSDFDADWGLAVVADPFTGEILAMADVSNAKRGIDDMWRSLSLAYEPGSVMKPIVVASALQTGSTSPDESFYCPGTMRVGGRLLTCIKHHGAETVHGAVRDSCNMVMLQLSQRLGQERLEPMFRSFGLFERSGLALVSQEAKGGIYCGNAAGRWGVQKTATVSYGKGVQVSAVAMLRGYSAIINGGTLPNMHLIRRLVDQQGRVVAESPTSGGRHLLGPDAAAAVRHMMRDVIADPKGTGHDAVSRLYNLAGKTGTSVAYGTGDKRIVSMAGYGPYEQPRLVTLVSVCEPRVGNRWGGGTCGGAMRSILERSLQYMGVPALAGSSEDQKKDKQQ
ncbi:MAG: hypothetical protein HZB16_07330 [Armatimonadetes bacterium]|nr:hypothetical protein [Armatimonadota bacterium]